jgi:hypothetical protein
MLLLIKIIYILVSGINLFKSQTSGTGVPGYIHTCKKGTDCKDLQPKALGCVALLQSESKCFFYKNIGLQGAKSISFIFNN